MIYEKFQMKEQGSTAGAVLTTYLLEDTPEFGVKKRPVVIVCPGGAYVYNSDREGEPLALQFTAKGYHAVVLRYSVAPEAHFPTALLELGRTVQMLRERAEEWHIDTDRIFLMGSSAGGHLVASYSCFWTKDWLREALGCGKEILRPNGLMLNYPVITSGEYAHRDSFKNLLADRYDELVEEMSLEKQVTEDNPPTFLWHTITDGLVPVENSMLFAKALKDKGVSVELHLYSQGGHGIGVATEVSGTEYWSEIVPICQSWVELAQTWILETFGHLQLGVEQKFFE